MRTKTRRGALTPWLVGVGLALGGYALGSSGGSGGGSGGILGSAAHADDGPFIPRAIAAPPVLAVEDGGWAIVGAADGRYFIVRPDGTSIEVLGDRRRVLLWR